MKIFHTDLQVGLANKLFEISGASLGLEKIRFTEDKIACTIHSELAPHGYYLIGRMAVSIQDSCDRCLIAFGSERDIPFSILLTSNTDLVQNDENDVIFYTDQEEAVDIRPVLAENILVNRPLKRLCTVDCKGLCSSCGCNWNEQDCNCSQGSFDSRWDALKNIK